MTEHTSTLTNKIVSDTDELLTVKEAAAYLRVSRVTAWRWCQQGLIPAFKIGRSWRIPRDELLKLKHSPFDQLKPVL